MKLHKLLSELALAGKGSSKETQLLARLPSKVKQAILSGSPEALKKLMSRKDAWLDHAAVPEMVIHQA